MRMKIIVERDAFAEALSSVKHVSDKGLKIPILGNVLLRANGSALEIAATNLDMRGESKVAAEITRDARDVNDITVPATILSDLTNQTRKGAQLVLEWDVHGKHVMLVSGRSRYKLNALPAADYPVLLPPDDAVTFKMSGKVLAEALKTVRWSIGGDISRSYLSGVFMHVTDDKHAALGASSARRLAIVACDAANLARFAIDAPPGLKALPPMIVPDSAIAEIMGLAKDAEEIEIAVSQVRLSVSNGRNVFLTKLIDGKFPDYDRVIPAGDNCRMLADVGALREALSRINALERGRRARATWSDALLTLTLNSEHGEAEEQIEVEFEGDQLQLPVSTAALISALDQIGTDTCVFRFTRSESSSMPIIINPMVAGSIDYSRTFLTMPMNR